MQLPGATCSTCSSSFRIMFRYQVRESGGSFHYYCSQRCLQSALGSERESTCSICGRHFELEYPYQVAVADGATRYYCGSACLTTGRAAPGRRETRPTPKRIAVFNHKGGTGKTTTAVNVAAALAERGQRVLLIDADGQGNVGASLGIRGERTLYHTLVVGTPASQAVVPVRPNLDVLTSNELLAAAELFLATRPNRDRVMREQLAGACASYDRVVIDCAPALSLMNQNVLVLADSVVIPVACEYLSLVGVRQVLGTLKQVRRLLGHRVELLGVIPTFYDVRNRMCREALKTLQDNFAERCFAAVRINTRLKEAPSAKQTIFEYAPTSHGAADYLRLAARIEQLTLTPEQPRSSHPVGPAPVQQAL
ncbi:MAG: AAA family ATPase [Proteobacteria bacterium]|nr:AAA family ATPase [Pseudomonadota bacterium]